MNLTNDDRRALSLILGLLLLAATARWLERPRPVLDDLPALDVAALEAASRDARPEASSPLRASERIDPNSASLQDLQRLPGVGTAMAQRIVEERQRAPFAAPADLQRVRGIGPALAERLAEHIAISGSTGGASGFGGGPGGGGAFGGSAVSGSAASALSSAPQRIELNRATASELQAVPGIGPALAGRLVARRDSLGRFRDWSEVDAVRGVGPAMLARLREMTVLVP